MKTNKTHETDRLPVAHGGSFKDRKRELVESFERIYLGRWLRIKHGNIAAVSRQAELSWRHTHKLLCKHGMAQARTRSDQFETQSRNLNDLVRTTRDV